MHPSQPSDEDIIQSQVQFEETTVGYDKKIWFFLKKHRIKLFIIALAIILITILFFVMPVIPVGKIKFVNLGATVKIEGGQTIKLKASDVSVVIDRYVDDECPIAGTCYGKDQTRAVFYKLNIKGINYAITSTLDNIKTPYKIETISSDYKSYAEIRIVDENAN